MRLTVPLIGLAVTLAASTTTSHAAISNTSPNDGETVTVDTSAPNPDTSGIFRPSVDNVTVNVLAGAGIDIGAGAYAIYGRNNWTVNNAGTIEAAVYAVYFEGPGTLNNSGAITSNGPYAVLFEGAADVTNGGTIQSNGSYSIMLSDSDDRLTLLPGSTISHLVVADLGTDTLTLGGDSGSDTFDLSDIGNTQQYRGFELFRKEGDSTWTLTGSGNHDWTVTDGTLVVNGTLGDVTLTGGTLKGTGTLGDLIASGGRVAPGNSIGTISVSGDFDLGAGATLDVEIHGDGTGDLVDATGSATLADGSAVDVSVIGGGSLIQDGDQWTIITADDGVADHGATITDDFAGFDFFGSVWGNSYLLTARESISLITHVSDPLARGVGGALDADHGLDADLDGFINGLRNLSNSQIEGALIASAPRNVEAAQAAQLRSTQSFHATLGNYLRGRQIGMPQLVTQTAGQMTLSGVQLASAAATDPRTLGIFLAQADQDPSQQAWQPAAGSAGASGDGAEGSRYGGFFAAYGVYDDRDSRGNALGARTDTYAGQIGLDYTLNDNWLAGLSFTYARSDTDFDGGLGSTITDTLRVGPYLGFEAGPWFADASLTYALHRNDLDRRIPALGSAFTADYDSHDVAAYIGGGYDMDLGRWRLTPQASLQYIHTWTDAYTESPSGGGGGGGALAVDRQEFDSLRSALGVSVSRPFEAAGVTIMPHANVGWAHEFLDDGENLGARFVGGTTSFTLATASGSGDSIFYGGGVTALLNERTSLDLGYQGETFEDSQTHALTVRLTLQF